ncbi:uncharacterized protein LOC134534012 [Bacillus rossius redtenbacheri]|uniref:uncharacterized protein LOC134534012 n=1 Tax=Bacillus rossius redtenbacheri TaxID=93214 RepID=UPI002FDEE8E0
MYVMSRRGNRQLVLDNYIYKRNEVSAVKTFWICTSYPVTRCRARVATVASMGDAVIPVCREHNHAPHTGKILQRLREQSMF